MPPALNAVTASGVTAPNSVLSGVIPSASGRHLEARVRVFLGREGLRVSRRHRVLGLARVAERLCHKL